MSNGTETPQTKIDERQRVAWTKELGKLVGQDSIVYANGDVTLRGFITRKDVPDVVRILNAIQRST